MSKGKCDNSIDDDNYKNVIIEFYPKLLDDILSSFDAIKEFNDENKRSELENTIKSLKNLDEQKSSHSIHLQEQEEHEQKEHEEQKENVENPTQQKPIQTNKVQPTTVEMEKPKTSESNPKENKEESAKKGGCCIIL